MKTLIIDDSSFAKRTLGAFLEKTFPDIEIILAGNGREGLATFLREKPDVIITDLLMPDVTGQEMIRQIRDVNTRIPIFVLTADIQRTTKFELAQYGITAFINKPLTRENEAFIKQMLGALSHVE